MPRGDGFGPAGMTRLWIGRSEDDPDVVATWGIFDLDEAGLDALRDDPDWMEAEAELKAEMSRTGGATPKGR